MEPLWRDHPDERPPLWKGYLAMNFNLNIKYILISTTDERPPLLKGHFSGAKGVASQQGFHCTSILYTYLIFIKILKKGSFTKESWFFRNCFETNVCYKMLWGCHIHVCIHIHELIFVWKEKNYNYNNKFCLQIYLESFALDSLARSVDLRAGASSLVDNGNKRGMQTLPYIDLNVLLSI